MNIKKYFKMNTAELFDMTFDIYGHTLGMQILYNLLVGILGSVLLFLVSYLAFSALEESLWSYASYERYELMSYFFTPFISSAVWTVFSVGNIHLARQSYLNESLTLGRAFKAMFVNIPRVLLIQMIRFVLYAPFFYFIFRIVFRMYAYLDNWSYIPDWQVEILKIVAIFSAWSILHTFFSIAIPIAVFERKYASAIAKSFKMVKENFKEVYGIHVIWAILNCVLYGWVTILSLFFMAALVPDYPDTYAYYYYWEAFFVAVAVIVILLGGFYLVVNFLVMQPLYQVLITNIYFNQKIKKEGMAISIGLSMLAQNQELLKSKENAHG